MRQVAEELLQAQVPQPDAQQMQEILEFQMDNKRMQPYLSHCSSLLRDSISHVQRALDENRILAEENRQWRDRITLLSEWQWHDSATACYDPEEKFTDMSLSSSFEVLAMDAKPCSLMSTRGESSLAWPCRNSTLMHDQASDQFLLHRQIKYNNEVHLEAKAGPSLEMQEPAHPQSYPETHPFRAVYQPEISQSKCWKTMCFCSADANGKAPAASPPQCSQFRNKHHAPQCVLSTRPEASTLIHFLPGQQLPNITGNGRLACPVAQESMCGLTPIHSEPAGQQLRNTTGSGENVAGAGELEEQIVNHQPSPTANTKPVRVLPPGVTTLVVRNVPARLSQEQLLQLWPPDGTYDLMYVPYSFKKQRRGGLVFINMVSHEAAINFATKWHGNKIPNISGAKRLDIGVADVQGFIGNLKHLKQSKIARMHNEQFLPVAFQGTQRLDFKPLLAQLST